ncbi:hypothetical protein [Streptomyces sp. NPDC056948]|uniref:hypothetical protein n=1 Tax=Streptomyces sp. NPDC056948 TaxID=3345975 RepID=UPI003645467C
MGHRTQTIEPREPSTTSVLTEPSYAAQILTVTARLLGFTAQTINIWQLERDLTTAADAVCGTLPEAVRHDASTRARASLPPLPLGTQAHDYAEQLRSAATGL